MFKTKKSRILVVGLALLVLAGGMLAGYLSTRPSTETGSKHIVIEVNAPDDSKTFDLYTEAEYLRAALDEAQLVGGDELGFGLFVKTVNGITIDEGKQEWWRISQSGEDLTVGVNDAVIADGDHYEFTLEAGY